MRVKVAAGFQVSHEGVVFMPGDFAEVPDDVAKSWIAQGWVTKARPVAKNTTPGRRSRGFKS